jgi:glycosyltransferase involved in cell wall biosynthesis
MTGDVHVVLPGGVNDPATPSGGNVYDRKVCAALTAAGRRLVPVTVGSGWPFPARPALDRLDAVLTEAPAGAVVLLDGIVACAAPEVVVPHAERLRLAVVVHLPLADETGLSPPVAAALDAGERRTLQAASVVVATSAAVGRRLGDRHGLDASRIVVAPPGVDPAPVTASTPSGTRLICVAAVTPRKGQDVLVEALAEVADLPWTCVCAGPLDRDPTHIRSVRARVGALGLEARIRFPGPLAGSDLAALYASADLLVLASRNEPYGMVVTEALARAIPVLGTDVDGVPEALGKAPDGAPPGLLVPPGDPAPLAAALRLWLSDPALRRRLRAAADRRRSRLRSWQATASILADVLGDLGRAA